MMSTLLSDKPKNKINPFQILGGIVGGFEENYETETSSMSSVTRGAGSIIEDVVDLFTQNVAGVEITPSEDQTEADKLSIGGKTELKFDKNQTKIETDRKKVFYQTLKDDQLRAQQAKDTIWLEEEINDITTNLSTEDKNELLKLQASYKNNKSTYHRAELRRKLIEKRRKADNQQKQASIPSPAKQPSALEGAFEGRSGTQGSGTANLSANATG